MNVKKRIEVDYSEPDFIELSKEVIWEAIDNDVVDNKLFKNGDTRLDSIVGQVTSVYTEGDKLFVDIETLPEFEIERNPEITLICEYVPVCSVCGKNFYDPSCEHWPGTDEDCKIIAKDISLMTFSIK